MPVLAYRGTREDPMPDLWYAAQPDVIDGFAVNRVHAPDIAVGEGVILYATRWGRVFAGGHVTAEPEQRSVQQWQGDRWPWWVATRIEVMVESLAAAPTLLQAGLGEVFIHPGSFARLTKGQFAMAHERLLAHPGSLPVA